MIDNYLNLSIEEIEKEKWENLQEYPTNLIKRAYEIRRKKISDYGLDDYRIAIDQDMGVEILVPFAVEKLKSNILLEAIYYPGDLLFTVLKKGAYWRNHLIESDRFKSYLIRKRTEIVETTEITDEIKEKLLSAVDAFIN